MLEIRVYTSSDTNDLFGSIVTGSIIIPWRNEKEVDYAIECPENGKHPKAQVEWVKRFIENRKDDSGVAEIFTNSPFIIEALDIYGKRIGAKMRYLCVFLDDIDGEPPVVAEGKHTVLRAMLECVDALEFADYQNSKIYK